MTTPIPDSLHAFYTQVWELALQGGSNHWCRATNQHAGPAGARVLVPRDGIPAGHYALWPVLAASDPFERPGFLPNAQDVRDAFTAILRTNAPAVQVDPGVRRALHLAEQERDVAKLDPALADVVLQVAVFGQVIYL